MTRKSLTLHELAAKTQELRAQGKTVVYCHGVFDLLHIGHIRYFKQAAEQGDVLVVTATPDRFVDKGPQRPAFNEALRLEALASLDVVDFAALNEFPTAEESLRLLRPDVYAKGAEFRDVGRDMTGKIQREAEVAAEVGARLFFADDIVFSSSNLINRFLSSLPEQVQEYLTLFRSRFSQDEVLGHVDRMAGLSVLIVGDAILDEYQYCAPIGKSSKDPVLAVEYQARDLFLGGALAVANHMANFAGQVRLLTVLGDIEREEEFIRAGLNPKVQPEFLTNPGAPTIRKSRILDGYSFSKLLEVYRMDSRPLPPSLEAVLAARIRDQARDADLVMVADYGHGMLGPAAVRALCDSAPYLGVNTQANAGNRGFNTIGKYPRADYVSLAEHELRLETRDLWGDVRPMMRGLKERMNARHFVVTQGRTGCAVAGPGDTFVKVPAFATGAVDRVGAGDAFYSVASLASRLGAPDEVIGFLGNVVGSLGVNYIGNKNFIDPMAVKKYVTSLLK